MQFSLRFALLFFVALAICAAQAANCWPSTGQELLAVPVGITFAICATWLAFEMARHRIRPRFQRRIGIALVAIGSLGCWLGLSLFALVGFNMFGARISADALARGRTQAMLFVVPSGLLVISAIASVWGARIKGRPNGDLKTRLIIVAAVLGGPLSLIIGLVVGMPPLGPLFGALAFGAFILDGGMGDKEEPTPLIAHDSPPATQADRP